jgi:hypothetical protein
MVRIESKKLLFSVLIGWNPIWAGSPNYDKVKLQRSAKDRNPPGRGSQKPDESDATIILWES